MVMAACSKALFRPSPVYTMARRSSASGASEYVAWRKGSHQRAKADSDSADRPTPPDP